jgi:hypothetical protein
MAARTWLGGNGAARGHGNADQYGPEVDGPGRYGPDYGGRDYYGPDYGEPDYGGPGRYGPDYPEPDYYEPDYPGLQPEDGSGRGPRRASRHRRGRRARPMRPGRRRALRVVLGLVIVFLVLVGWSVGRALTVPGGGTFSDRLAEWARDHYLGAVVTFGEWLTYQPPKVGGKPDVTMTGGPSAAVAGGRPARKTGTAVVTYNCPTRLKSLAGRNLAGEGVWRVLATVNGDRAICGTYLRGSSVYSSYVAGIAYMNQNLVKFQLRPGAEDPGPGNWKAQPWIPPGTRLGLLATFNGGFKINASGGGFYLNGSSDGALIRGVASVVYYRNGRIAIGVWGQSVHMTPGVVGVRQNLHLIVINGRVPGTVDQNVETSWGATLGGGYYVWRSGIGMTKDGQVVYAYGPSLNVRELAQILQRAGAVTAMQLDINPAWMSYMFYLPGGSPANPVPHNLLSTQQEPADRYYYINSRDFTAVYAR